MDTDKLLERIENKLDKMDARLDGLEMTLAVQTQVLDEHMRRTQLAEETLAIVNAEQVVFRATLKEQSIIWAFLGRLVAGIGVGAGAVAAVYRLWITLSTR